MSLIFPLSVQSMVTSASELSSFLKMKLSSVARERMILIKATLAMVVGINPNCPHGDYVCHLPMSVRTESQEMELVVIRFYFPLFGK